MRWFLSFGTAIIVAIALFLMMYSLVNQEQTRVLKPSLVQVDIRQVESPEQAQQTAQITPKPEPKIEPLDFANTVPVKIVEPVELDLNESDYMPLVESSTLSDQQAQWTQPVKGQAKQQDYIGKRDSSKKEVVPVSTRRPNIPKVAYENQVDGWVLLAVKISPEGRVIDTRVMDAFPRGIFEENAIRAVQGWRYTPFKGEPIHLSQRIEFEWSMYSYNMDW